MKEYLTDGTGALWNDFDLEEQAEVSLLQPEECLILESLEDNPQLLSRTLFVKAVFQGLVIDHSVQQP